jgi:hypothetical protein
MGRRRCRAGPNALVAARRAPCRPPPAASSPPRHPAPALSPPGHHGRQGRQRLPRRRARARRDAGRRRRARRHPRRRRAAARGGLPCGGKAGPGGASRAGWGGAAAGRGGAGRGGAGRGGAGRGGAGRGGAGRGGGGAPRCCARGLATRERQGRTSQAPGVRYWEACGAEAAAGAVHGLQLGKQSGPGDRGTQKPQRACALSGQAPSSQAARLSFRVPALPLSPGLLGCGHDRRPP